MLNLLVVWIRKYFNAISCVIENKVLICTIQKGKLNVYFPLCYRLYETNNYIKN